MADFEDANSPTWRNQVEGHLNLIDAIEGTITYDGADGRHYELVDNPATLLVRPRGWHLPEKHLTLDGEPVAGAFMDFGLYAFHYGRRLAERNRGPLPLPAEAGAPPRGGALERRLHLHPRGARRSRAA